MSNSCVGRFSQQLISQTRLLLRVYEFSVNYVLLISLWKITVLRLYKNVYIVVGFTVFWSVVSDIY